MAVSKAVLTRGVPPGVLTWAPIYTPPGNDNPGALWEIPEDEDVPNPLGEDWLPCRGQSITFQDYPKLFGLLPSLDPGSEYRVLPNAHHRVLIGANYLGGVSPQPVPGAHAVGSYGGSELKSITTRQVANHWHDTNEVPHSHVVTVPAHTHYNPPYTYTRTDHMVKWRSDLSKEHIRLPSLPQVNTTSAFSFNSFPTGISNFYNSSSGGGAPVSVLQPVVYIRLYIKVR